MSEQPQPPEPPQPNQQPQPPAGQAPPEGEPPPREVLDEARRQAAEARMRVREAEDENKRLQRQVEAATDRDKSDLDKEKARADRLEKRLATMEHQQARHEVAAERKVPVEVLEHVRGDDRALLEATADRVVDYAKGVAEAAIEAALAAAEAPRPRRSTDPVARGVPVSEPLDMNEFIRAGFRR